MGFGGMKGGSVAYELVEEDLEGWGSKTFGDPTRYLTFAAHMNPVCADDAAPQVLYFPKSLHIPAGVTLAPSNRCKGLYIFVNGHLKIDGTISMSALGAAAAGVDTPLSPVIRKARNLRRTIGKTTTISEDLFDVPFGSIGTVPAAGGAGGAAVSRSGSGATAGLAGTAGTNRACGGGGSGCAGTNTTGSPTSGRGGNGSAYSGGPGGGCAWTDTAGAAPVGGAGSDAGGAGGNQGRIASTYSSSGGVGNPGGTGTAVQFVGTGGVIFLVVRGEILITAAGIIAADGVAANGSFVYSGGSSGGGSVNVVYGANYTNLGSVRANGGAAAGTNKGGAGGAGCVTVEKLGGLLA